MKQRKGSGWLDLLVIGGAFAPLNFGTGGLFSFVTSLPLNHTADGLHSEHLKATDNAGNVSFFDVSFTLDTVTPTIAVTSPAPALVTNQNVTIAGETVSDTIGQRKTTRLRA